MNTTAFSSSLTRYAELLVGAGGVNLRRGQHLLLTGDAEHGTLLDLIGQAAHARGAASVDCQIRLPMTDAALIRSGDDVALRSHFNGMAARRQRILELGGAALSVRGREPVVIEQAGRDFPVRFGQYKDAGLSAVQLFRDVGINAGRCPWAIGAGATTDWAEIVYPGDPEGVAKLWDDIFKFTHLLEPDAEAATQTRVATLNRRAALLNKMGLRRVRISGGGNDFEVVLSPDALWASVGGDRTAAGQEFLANNPSFECWTFPLRNSARGTLRASMPFMADGTLISGFVGKFVGGRLEEYSVDAACKEAFEKFLSTDEGTRFLGELALVASSPIGATKRVYQMTLLDENAWGHVAFGNAYAINLRNGQTMSIEQLIAAGLNKSRSHVDFMWGSPEVVVEGFDEHGTRFLLIEHDSWAGELAAV